MLQFDAEGGSIRALDPNNEKLNLMVSVGLSEALVESEHCMRVDDCYCGVATRKAGVIVIQDFRHAPPSLDLNCQREGFASVAVFRIVARDEVLGSYSLHFRSQRKLAPSESQLLETLGQHLGVALDNRRLSAQARQLAVVQERGLVAQGLRQPGAGPEFPEPAIADAGRRGQARRRRRGRGNPAAAAYRRG